MQPRTFANKTVNNIDCSFVALFISLINNNALKFPDERNDPYKWPLNIVAQMYSGAHDPERANAYMLGNPFIWGPHLILIILLPILIPALIIKTGIFKYLHNYNYYL